MVRGPVRKCSGSVPARPKRRFWPPSISPCWGLAWGARSRSASATRPLAPLMWVVGWSFACAHCPPGASVCPPRSIHIRGARGAPWPPKLTFWSFVLAIPHSLAPQERRARALLVRRFGGALYFLLNAHMDVIKKDASSYFNAAYARNQQPRYRREEHFHLGWTFDVMVIVTLLIAVLGYFTA